MNAELRKMSDTLDMRALARRLAPIYVKDDLATGGITRAGLARLCDEAIDPSGRLLGYIREEAFPYKKTAQSAAASPAPRNQTPDACAFPASPAPANAEWQWVPKVPTPEMERAVFCHPIGPRRFTGNATPENQVVSVDTSSEIYRAMLAAAPAAPLDALDAQKVSPERRGE